MAIDTAAKRFSLIDFDAPYQPGLSTPDNATDIGDRFALMWLYAADESVPPPEPEDYQFNKYALVSVGQLMGFG